MTLKPFGDEIRLGRAARVVLVATASRAVFAVPDEHGVLRTKTKLARSPQQTSAAFALHVSRELSDQVSRSGAGRAIVAAPPAFLELLQPRLTEEARRGVELFIREDLSELSHAELSEVIAGHLRRL